MSPVPSTHFDNPQIKTEQSLWAGTLFFQDADNRQARKELGQETQAGKSYFAKTCQERLPRHSLAYAQRRRKASCTSDHSVMNHIKDMPAEC